jgi:hypothetical protein
MKSISLPVSGTMHHTILQLVNNRRNASVNIIRRSWAEWDSAERNYRAWRVEDKDDRESDRINKVKKIIVPVTFAQVQTNLTFLLATFTDRDPLFPVPPRTLEFAKAAEANELVLDAQMDQIRIFTKMYLALRDFLVLGRMILHTDYLRKVKRTRRKTEEFEDVEFFGSVVPVLQEKTRTQFDTIFEGNEVSVVNPRRFYHDPYVTLQDLQDGEYAGHTTFTNLVNFLRTVDSFQNEDNPFINIEEVRKSEPAREIVPDDFANETPTFSHTQNQILQFVDKYSKPLVMDQIVIDLIPAEVKDGNGRALGTSTWPEKWLFGVANQRIITRAHRYENEHQMYPYSAAEPYPDSHNLVTPSMVDMLSGLQEHFDYLLNSHWANVRKAVHNKLIVDPSRVVLQDVRSSDPAGVIRVKQEAYGDDVRTMVSQLPITDITRSHVEDSKVVFDLMQRVSASPDNLMGQISQGRRSATEISSTQRLAAGRQETLAKLAWDNGLSPMIMQMVMNNQQFMSQDVWVKTLGRKIQHLEPVKGVQMLNITSAELQGQFAFPAFEGTLPTQETAQAKLLAEMLKTLLVVPGMAQVFDIQKIFMEAMRKSGVHSVEDFVRMEGPPPTELTMQGGQSFSNGQVSEGTSSDLSQRPGELEKEVRPATGVPQNGAG